MKIKGSQKRTQSESIVFLLFLAAAPVVYLAGCSSMERSVSLGFAAGAAGGTGVGLGIGGRNRTQTTLLSAGIGAAVGGITSYLIHGGLEKRDDQTRRDTLFNLENHGVAKSYSGQPNLSNVDELLSMPEVEEDWVDTQSQGNKLIEGHRVWTITNGATWDLSKNREKRKRK